MQIRAELLECDKNVPNIANCYDDWTINESNKVGTYWVYLVCKIAIHICFVAA